jgi:hypothetical protein
MATQTRRTFLTTATALTLGVTYTSFAMEKENPPLVHHVFFWLKNPSSKEDLAKLLEGLRTLKKIETIKMLHIGIPASTEKRDVVDNSYSASELMLFDDLAGQKTYQDHPIHQKFIENCSHLWDKVIVYDAISA